MQELRKQLNQKDEQIRQLEQLQAICTPEETSGGMQVTYI